MKILQNKGITLVALVVTIVIILMLAGVSINMVLGENGLITKKKEAKEKEKRRFNCRRSCDNDYQYYSVYGYNCFRLCRHKYAHICKR